MHFQIHRFDTLDSTNKRLKDMARQGAKPGTVVMSQVQTGGKGRGQRTWHSPVGGVYFSVLLSPKDPKRATDLAILAGLAITQTVKEILPKQFDITVKWPNDCLVDFKKVAGVLCENLSDETRNLCVVGAGINVNTDPKELIAFQGNPFPATSFLELGGGGRFDPDQVLNTALTKINNLYTLYMAEGFSSIKELWESNCLFVGKQVEFTESGWRESGTPDKIKGKMKGIDESGAFVLSDESGKDRIFHSGELVCYSP